ncbi:MAG: TIGR02452 family protein [Opitutales bacterium]
MSNFEVRIPRDLARQLGEEAVQVARRGRYVRTDGTEVVIDADIARAVAGTVHYPPGHEHETPATGPHTTSFEVTNETTLSAARRHLEGGLRTAALNFASATSPGGGFLSGARAQEEYLCRSSTLHECLRHSKMYDLHRALDDPLYTDAMSYSPDVPVFRGDDHAPLPAHWKVSIITSAACLATQVPALDRPKIGPVMWSRMLKVLSVARFHGHDALVLGAWGCGAFGNDGDQVAGMFRKALTQEFKGAFRSVTFAIVDSTPEARFIGPFRRAFSHHIGQSLN